jgi:hypothetical protein
MSEIPIKAMFRKRARASRRSRFDDFMLLSMKPMSAVVRATDSQRTSPYPLCGADRYGNLLNFAVRLASVPRLTQANHV